MLINECREFVPIAFDSVSAGVLSAAGFEHQSAHVLPRIESTVTQHFDHGKSVQSGHDVRRLVAVKLHLIQLKFLSRVADELRIRVDEYAHYIDFIGYMASTICRATREMFRGALACRIIPIASAPASTAAIASAGRIIPQSLIRVRCMCSSASITRQVGPVDRGAFRPMPKDQFVAIDCGAESGRVVLAALENDRLTMEERHRFTTPVGRMNGQLQWNVLGIWEEIKAGLRRCALDGANKRQIDGIAIDAWGVDFGLIAPSGEILANPVHYRDRRTDGVMERVHQRISKQRIFEITGVQFMPINTLYQLIALQQSNSSLLAAAETLLFIPDLFNYLLTGKRQSEN